MFKSTIARLLILLLPFTTVLAKSAAGGLQFLKHPSIAIQRQDISINLDQVTVNYVFINNSPLDIIETLVFTIPYASYDHSYNNNQEALLKRYEVYSNDRKVDYKVMVRPISFQGEDLYDFFRSLGLSANPLEAMAQINADYNSFAQAKKYLLDRNLIDPGTNTAKWLTKTYYYWQQKFPPAEEVVIRQTYKPNVNLARYNIAYNSEKRSSEKSNLGVLDWFNKHKRDDLKANDQIKAQDSEISAFAKNIDNQGIYLRKYCPTYNDYQQMLQSFALPTSKTNTMVTREINFNLMYDNNWSSPIEHFTLKIEHPPNNIVMMCWPEPMQQLNETTLLYEAKHYVPLHDIRLLLVKK